MSGHRRAVFAIVPLWLALSAGGAQAFDVTFDPSGPISPNDSIDLTIDVTTSSSPASLSQPTTVAISGSRIAIGVSIDTGIDRAIDQIQEVVTLGPLAAGSWQWTVAVTTTQLGANPLTEIESGTFDVIPEPSVALLLALGLGGLSLGRRAA